MHIVHMYVKLGLQILYAVEQFSSLLFKVTCAYAVESLEAQSCSIVIVICCLFQLISRFLATQHFHSALGFMASQ